MQAESSSMGSDIPPTGPGDAGRVGIICALPQEAAALASLLDGLVESTIGPLAIQHGRISGIPVTIALAGIGKVDAAMAAALVGSLGVRAFVVAGVAGSLNPAVAIGDLVIGTRLIQHDYGLATDEGHTMYAPGQLPVPGVAPEIAPRLDIGVEIRVRRALDGVAFPAASLRLDEPPRRPTIHFGTIATGDIFVNGVTVRERLADLGALAVDMESAAVGRVADRFGVPCLAVRSASDLAGRESALDLAAFLLVAARTVAAAVEVVLPALAEEPAR